MTVESYYTLPSSATIRCLDRFSLVTEAEEDENGEVPFWSIFSELLSANVTSSASLIDLLETIAVTLHGSTGIAGDYGTLRGFLESRPDFYAIQWPKLVQIALSMPEAFPSNTLPILGAKCAMTCLQLSQRQVACLVVHQFLYTLKAPSWKDDGMHHFAVWYGSEQRHPQAVVAYLEALFLYFEQVAEDCTLDALDGQWAVQYDLRDASSLRSDASLMSHKDLPLSNVDIRVVEQYSTDPQALGLPNGACVVSANRFIGFGQSATQEEIHVGCSPEACPAVLVTPPLENDQVLVVRGAEAMLNITGQRREISINPQQPLPKDAWRQRTMLFMDALELDMVSSEDGLPDLQPGNIDREIQKATIAFSSGNYDEVLIGLWGCGAFCGDPGVKMSAVWCAASLAGVKLTIVYDTSQRALAEEYAAFSLKAKECCGTVGHLRQLLDLAPKNLERYSTVKWLNNSLSKGL